MIRTVGAVVVAASVLAMAGCSDDGASSALTRADVESLAELHFPESTRGYRSTRDADGTLYVRCDVAADDVTTFARESDLSLVADRRVIVHASPLWDLNPDGDRRGATSTVDGIRRDVEVVTTSGSARAEVRIVVTAAS